MERELWKGATRDAHWGRGKCETKRGVSSQGGTMSEGDVPGIETLRSERGGTVRGVRSWGILKAGFKPTEMSRVGFWEWPGVGNEGKKRV